MSIAYTGGQIVGALSALGLDGEYFDRVARDYVGDLIDRGGIARDAADPGHARVLLAVLDMAVTRRLQPYGDAGKDDADAGALLYFDVAEPDLSERGLGARLPFYEALALRAEHTAALVEGAFGGADGDPRAHDEADREPLDGDEGPILACEGAAGYLSAHVALQRLAVSVANGDGDPLASDLYAAEHRARLDDAVRKLVKAAALAVVDIEEMAEHG